MESGTLDGGAWAYVVHRTGRGGPDDQRMTLLDPASGRVADDFPLPAAEPGAAVVRASSAVEIRLHGSQDVSPSPGVHDAVSGERLWDHTPGGAGRRPCALRGEPLLYGETVLTAHACAEPELLAAPAGGARAGGTVEVGVLALDASTGEEVWRRDWSVDSARWYPAGPLMSLGGPPLTEGAHRTLELTLYGAWWADHVLDPATGEDVVRLPDPAGLGAPHLVHSGSATAVYTDPDGSARLNVLSVQDGERASTALEGLLPSELGDGAVALARSTVLVAPGAGPREIPLAWGTALDDGAFLCVRVPGAVAVTLADPTPVSSSDLPPGDVASSYVHGLVP